MHEFDTTRDKRGINLNITYNEKVLLVWTLVCLIAGGVVTSL